MSEALKGLKEQYLRCVRCGQCRSVCPVFEVVRNETATPRGKVFLAHLLATGELEATSQVQAQLSRCLLCRSCSKECPSAIPVHQIVTAARAELAEKTPSPTKRLVFKKIWARPRRLALAARLTRTIQALGLDRLGLSLRMLPPGFALPGRLPRRPAHTTIPAINPAIGETRLRVGYFLGCSTNFMFPGVAASTVAVLSRLGCEVVIPPELKCCGLPQLASGEAAAASALASANSEVFRLLKVQTVVSDCASCTVALKETPEFAGIKVTELSELLLELVTKYSPGFRQIQKPVTYHYPCHLSKAQGITEAPRDLLLLTCRDFREMDSATDCCGSGGTFALYHYQTSMAILDKKIAAIKKSGAEIVATSCPTCIMQLRHGLARHGYKIDVVHSVELLEKSFEHETLL
ncbi:MAG: (Fe-S)-binding protein [Desulfotomaculaceae bacterium]|nr:(Fe-S)-binding protein [Desulfotomaculaceae bacterium]